MIRDQSTVFLGAVLQPKTLEPIWIQRKEFTYRTVDIITRGGYDEYFVAGSGYLDGGDMGDEYLRAVKVSGLPRAHTPNGVQVKGGGYGTALYTGLVLLATAIEDKKIWPGHGFPGKGDGICSDDNTRSRDATKWWGAAVKRGLAKQEHGEIKSDEEETEELEDEDLVDYMSRQSTTKIVSLIEEAVSNHDGWWPRNIVMRGDLQRDVSADSVDIVVDFVTLDLAEQHKLIAVIETTPGSLQEWGRRRDFADGTYHGGVITALNVSNQSPLIVGRLAACALQDGASEVAVTAMVMRNRYGIDLLDKAIGRRPASQMRMDRGHYAGGGIMLDDPRNLAGSTPNPGRRRRSPPARELPPIVRRNPGPEPSAVERLQIERDNDRLRRAREDLGWDKLEDLP